MTEFEGKTLTVDVDAVRGIVGDIRNGEHYSWGSDWDQSNAELLEGFIENFDTRILAAVQEGAHQALSSFRDEHGFSLIEDESAESLDRKERRAVAAALALLNGADR